MKVKELIAKWTDTPPAKKRNVAKDISLTTFDHARVCALMDLFPGKSKTDILSDLVVAALDEVEEALPYQAGAKVIREDEYGDPIFEDVGPTPRFEALVKEHVKRLKTAEKHKH